MCVLKILPNRTEGKERKCVFCPLERTLTWNRIDMLGDKLQTWTWKLQRFVGKETTEKMWRKKIHWKSIEKNLKTYEILLNAIEEPTHTISPIGTKKRWQWSRQILKDRLPDGRQNVFMFGIDFMCGVHGLQIERLSALKMQIIQVSLTFPQNV